jgi:hypothetical protein
MHPVSDQLHTLVVSPPGRVLPVPLAKSWTKYGDKKASAWWKVNPSYPDPQPVTLLTELQNGE